MITKHYYKSIVRAALLLAVTMCITGLAPTFSTSAMAFDLGTLNGAYGGNNSNWVTVSGNANPAVHPISSRELITFDGAGHLTNDQLIDDAGTIVRQTVTSTYTVNSNGTGQMSWTDPQGVFHMRDFVIVNGNAQLNSIEDPDGGPIAGAGTFIKQ